MSNEYWRLLGERDQKTWTIIERILKKERCSHEDLAEATGFSERTIQRELKRLTEMCPGLSITYCRTTGVSFETEPQVTAECLYGKLLAESPEIALLEQLFFTETATLNQLREDLYLDARSLKRMLEQLLIPLNQWGLTITYRPKVSIAGDQEQLFCLFFNLFKEKYLSQGNVSSPLSELFVHIQHVIQPELLNDYHEWMHAVYDQKEERELALCVNWLRQRKKEPFWRMQTRCPAYFWSVICFPFDRYLPALSCLTNHPLEPERAQKEEEVKQFMSYLTQELQGIEPHGLGKTTELLEALLFPRPDTGFLQKKHPQFLFQLYERYPHLRPFEVAASRYLPSHSLSFRQGLLVHLYFSFAVTSARYHLKEKLRVALYSHHSRTHCIFLLRTLLHRYGKVFDFLIFDHLPSQAETETATIVVTTCGEGKQKNSKTICLSFFPTEREFRHLTDRIQRLCAPSGDLQDE